MINDFVQASGGNPLDKYGKLFAVIDSNSQNYTLGNIRDNKVYDWYLLDEQQQLLQSGTHTGSHYTFQFDLSVTTGKKYLYIKIPEGIQVETAFWFWYSYKHLTYLNLDVFSSVKDISITNGESSILKIEGNGAGVQSVKGYKMVLNDVDFLKDNTVLSYFYMSGNGNNQTMAIVEGLDWNDFKNKKNTLKTFGFNMSAVKLLDIPNFDISDFTALKELYLNATHWKSLDFFVPDNITNLNISGQVDSGLFELTGGTGLTNLFLRLNTEIPDTWIYSLSNLNYISLRDMSAGGRDLDFTPNTLLGNMSIRGVSDIDILDLSNNSNFTNLYLHSTGISQIFLPTSLLSIAIYFITMNEIDLSHCNNLNSFNAPYHRINKVNLKNGNNENLNFTKHHYYIGTCYLVDDVNLPNFENKFRSDDIVTDDINVYLNCNN